MYRIALTLSYSKSSYCTYLAGLKIVSGERVWTEVKKTLGGKYAGDLMLTMLEVGVGRRADPVTPHQSGPSPNSFMGGAYWLKGFQIGSGCRFR